MLIIVSSIIGLSVVQDVYVYSTGSERKISKSVLFEPCRNVKTHTQKNNLRNMIVNVLEDLF